MVVCFQNPSCFWKQSKSWLKHYKISSLTKACFFFKTGLKTLINKNTCENTVKNKKEQSWLTFLRLEQKRWWKEKLYKKYCNRNIGQLTPYKRWVGLVKNEINTYANLLPLVFTTVTSERVFFELNHPVSSWSVMHTYKVKSNPTQDMYSIFTQTCNHVHPK